MPRLEAFGKRQEGRKKKGEKERKGPLSFPLPLFLLMSGESKGYRERFIPLYVTQRGRVGEKREEMGG